MIKALIVEDEVLARLGLHQLVDWEKLGFSLLEDAKDGREALEIIEREQPQVLLLDLNLPKVNGLQIQQYIAQQRIRCHIVVISCNEDFTVVKEVMKRGAFDFLRKLNLTGEELTRVLLKCRDSLENPVGDASEAPPSRRVCRYDEAGGKTELLTGGYDRLLCVITQNLEKDVVSCMEDTLNACGAAYWILVREQQPLFIVLRSSGPEPRELQRQWEQALGVVYVGVCDQPVSSMRALYQAALLAEQIQLPAYYDAVERLHFYTQKMPRLEKCPFVFAEDIGRFQNALSILSIEDAEFAVRTLFSRIRAHDFLGVNILRRMFMDLLSVYSTAAQALGGSIEDISLNGRNCHYQLLMTLESLLAIEQWFADFTRAFVDHFYIAYVTSRSDILRKTLDYVNGHLDSPIQLAAVAKSIGVSEAYLCTLFKREMRQNFISYVNEAKVEQAKKMLGSGMRVYEVSERLGFENCTYFSKVFKKYTKITPDAYRKQCEKPQALGEDELIP